jgi:hypothetical protein
MTWNDLLLAADSAMFSDLIAEKISRDIKSFWKSFSEFTKRCDGFSLLLITSQ